MFYLKFNENFAEGETVDYNRTGYNNLIIEKRVLRKYIILVTVVSIHKNQ